MFLKVVVIFLSFMCVRSSVMSNSSWPHWLQPARLLCPWAFFQARIWKWVDISSSTDPCYACCPNPPTGKDKTSMTMQHAKEGKFIADSSQGPCCNQRSGAKSESPEPQSPRTFIGCPISNISSGWWVQADWLHVCKAILLVQTFQGTFLEVYRARTD